MKNKNVFDMLEDAEDEPMKELTDNCPDISKEQFERLLEKTERRYTMRKNEIDKNINEQSENTVSGVERVKRPAWIKPITMAASFVLVAGMVIGSVALLNKNSKNNKNSSDNKIASDTINEQEADDEKTVFNDKDALIDLCTDIPGHFNKMTLSYKAEYFSGSYKSITDVKMEYDKSEKALLVDSYDRYIEDNPENCYDLNFIYYFYKNKRISVKPVDTSFDYAHRWFTVDSLYDTPSDDPIYNFHGVSEWDYKGMFSGIYPESKEEWAIIGRDTVCGRECVVIQDTSVPTSITTYIDSQTGIRLKEVWIYNDEVHKFEVTGIKLDGETEHITTPLEFRQMIEENGYEPTVDDGSLDPAVICNLNFLGIPEQPFTTAVPQNNTVTTSTRALPFDEEPAAPDMEKLTGQWKCQIPEECKNHQSNADETFKWDNCTFTINNNGTFSCTAADGTVSEGTVKTELACIFDAKIPTVALYVGEEELLGGYYFDLTSPVIRLYDGTIANLVRE